MILSFLQMSICRKNDKMEKIERFLSYIYTYFSNFFKPSDIPLSRLITLPPETLEMAIHRINCMKYYSCYSKYSENLVEYYIRKNFKIEGDFDVQIHYLKIKRIEDSQNLVFKYSETKEQFERGINWLEKNYKSFMNFMNFCNLSNIQKKDITFGVEGGQIHPLINGKSCHPVCVDYVSDSHNLYPVCRQCDYLLNVSLHSQMEFVFKANFRCLGCNGPTQKMGTYCFVCRQKIQKMIFERLNNCQDVTGIVLGYLKLI